jgi:hypothetical protein
VATGSLAPPRPRSSGVARALAVVTVGAVVVYALVSLVFVFRGRLNADEGWYLYAGRLAWRGQLPYRDFAFTQMPLTAYVYGLLQIVKQSLYLGRITSLGFAVAAVAFCVRVAWREAGRVAGATVALLCVAFPTGIYNLTLTKTYALGAFFLAAVLFALTSPGRTTRTWPLATAAAIALTFTRSTGLPLTILVVLWCIARAPDRATRRRVVGVTAVGGLVAAAFLLNDFTAAKYNLITFHGLLWHGADGRARLDEIVHTRLPDWLGDYPAYFALMVASVGAIYLSSPLRRYLARKPGVAIVGLGIVGTLVAQLVAGEWAPVEYASPVIPALLAVTVIMLTHAVRPAGGWAERRGLTVLAGVAVAAVAISTLFHPGVGEYFTSSKDAGAVEAANRVGNYLHDHTQPGDEVLTLWAQPAGLVSGRDQVDGITAGVFSYEDLTTADANDVHFVNADLLRRTLREGRPGAVVITGIDDLVFNFTGTFSQQKADPQDILGELGRHYTLAHEDVTYGTNGPTTVRVYLRNDRK